jgi:hypothetical protein
MGDLLTKAFQDSTHVILAALFGGAIMHAYRIWRANEKDKHLLVVDALSAQAKEDKRIETVVLHVLGSDAIKRIFKEIAADAYLSLGSQEKERWGRMDEKISELKERDKERASSLKALYIRLDDVMKMLASPSQTPVPRRPEEEDSR